MITTSLLLNRESVTEDATLGRFFWGNECLYYTVEDRSRLVKVYGKTAIPCGIYRVDITESARFKKRLPILLGVPGFTGIRIHAGNTSKDTDGCIIIGLKKEPNGVSKSQLAMSDFMPRLQTAILRGNVWLTVKDVTNVPPL